MTRALVPVSADLGTLSHVEGTWLGGHAPRDPTPSEGCVSLDTEVDSRLPDEVVGGLVPGTGRLRRSEPLGHRAEESSAPRHLRSNPLTTHRGGSPGIIKTRRDAKEVLAAPDRE
jgi:hypothetical protein